MADGPNAASNQFPHDDVEQPESGSMWRAGQPLPSHPANSAEVIHTSNEDTTHELNMVEYGECYDPNYKDDQHDTLGVDTDGDNDGDK